MYFYRHPMDGYDVGWGIVMMFFWLVFFIVIALVAVRVLRHNGPHAHGGRDPVDIAKERYAKGEITKEEFDQLKRDLK